MKAPCSPGWVSPRRGQGPGTQSILPRRDFQAEGLEQWKVLLSVEGHCEERFLVSALIHTVTLAEMPPNYPRCLPGIQLLLGELRQH
ncbi:hypothetical protein JOQ06_012447 [Pogonophryne albipinna]|uniref:Uncharacterized protein n=1 Tax=Pogonophryne albipinna TaxID=1090488 RepID=A0AAD6FP56_9TELE|nr:hypothetical protein JOQ06_012447 [Pogonophryne albipinna]